MSRRRKTFFHGALIQYLCATTQLDLEVKKAIAEGICFSLVMDWLSNASAAEAHYWDVPPEVKSDALAYVTANTTSTQRQYYEKLATWFHAYTQNGGVALKKERLQFDIPWSDGSTYTLDVPQSGTLIETTNAYAQYHEYSLNFDSGQEYIHVGDIIRNACDWAILLANRLGQMNAQKILLNLFFLRKNNEGEFSLLRHSIGLQQTTMGYDIFDPTRGVYKVTSLCAFMGNMLRYYKTITGAEGQVLVGYQCATM